MKYKLVYLPVARRDMVEIVEYVSHRLGNPIAANELAEKLIAGAESIPVFPYANPVKTTLRPLAHEYRYIIIGNYQMFYRVDEITREVLIARVIYAGRNSEKLLS